MNAAFQLVRGPARPANALFLPGAEPAALRELCTRLGPDIFPEVYPVAGGFLVVASGGPAPACPGTVRLRRLAPCLFVPVDADLVPPLFDDEAAALTRDRGLVILPGERVLAFDPAAPLVPASLLRARLVRRPEWQAPPEPATLAEQLRAVTRDQPPDDLEQVLQAGAPEPVEDDGFDEEGPASAAARARAALGQALVRLGQGLGMEGLTRRGAEWIRQALRRDPQLLSRLLGRQEASLRKLLELFRGGDLERALRHAPRLTDTPSGRGPQAPSSGQLPDWDPRYSLDALLGGGSGAGAVWVARHELYERLRAEYHKAAREAVARGDYRRAAYVFGRLLGDFRSAADALLQGGHCRDAAVIYKTKLGDYGAAARAFDRAGLVDEALFLYRQRGDHLSAAELLRRTGDEEGAVEEYLRAAAAAGRASGAFAAAELLRTRAGRLDLARPWYERGWAERPGGCAVACAAHLLPLTAADGLAALDAFLDGALPVFEDHADDETAGKFFHQVAQLGMAASPDRRDQLRDRALCAAAARLRARSRAVPQPGDVVGRVLAPLDAPGAWPAPVRADADFAFAQAVAAARPSGRAAPRTIRTAPGTVTAACHAPLSGEVFLGLGGGEVACLHPSSGGFVTLDPGPGPVIALAADAHGRTVVVLRRTLEDQVVLECQQREGSVFTLQQRKTLTTRGEVWLAPRVLVPDPILAVLGDAEAVILFSGHQLLPRTSWLVGPTVAGFAVRPEPEGPALILVLGDEHLACLGTQASKPEPDFHNVRWTPRPAPGSSLAAPPVAWAWHHDSHLELAGLESDGRVACLQRFFGSPQPQDAPLRVTSSTAGYRAVALLRPGRLVAVAPGRVDLLDGRRLQRLSSTEVDLSEPVACFTDRIQSRLILVAADAAVQHLPIPR